MRNTLALCSAIAGLSLLASPAHAGDLEQDETYSIMTYNIGGKPGFTGYALDNGSSCEERAKQIGMQIVAMPDPPDILIFAEATGDCYKDGLVAQLHTEGPYASFIYQMGDAGRAQDSGLMFFSKFPWVLPGQTKGTGCKAPELVNPKADTDGFGQATGRNFHMYTDLAASDRLMEKGIGYACVTNPITEQAINVFFTHNQANYWNPITDDLSEFYNAERWVNMLEAAAFINLWAPADVTSADGQAVIFAGDMNIMGDDLAYWVNQDPVPSSNGLPQIESVVLPWNMGGILEYAGIIGPGGLLDKETGLRDPWRTDGTPAPSLVAFTGWSDGTTDMGFVYDPSVVNRNDLGFTWDAYRNGQTENDEFRTRLDYILDRQVTHHGSENCYQHMIVERGFRYDPTKEVLAPYVGADLSDHYPLRAVIGRAEPHCNPHTAWADRLGSTSVTVEHGGGHKWFYYSQPGTYVFDAVNPGNDSAVEVRVFAASDLSTPLQPRDGDTTIMPTQGSVDLANEPVTYKTTTPFYVQLRFANRGHVGSFTWKAQKNDCSSPEKAEIVDPFVAEHHAMGSLPMLQTRCFLKIQQNAEVIPGEPVEVHVLAANMVDGGTPGTARIELYSTPPPSVGPPFPDDYGSVGDGDAELHTKLNASDDPRYLVVDRTSQAGVMGFDLVWTRNVTTVSVDELAVIIKDDNSASDEIAVFWSIEDEGAQVLPMDITAPTCNGSPNSDSMYFYSDMASGGFSRSPAVFPLTPFSRTTEPSRIQLAYPEALWGLVWEMDGSSSSDPDDQKVVDVFTKRDNRILIEALDPDPWLYIERDPAATSRFEVNTIRTYLPLGGGLLDAAYNLLAHRLAP